jgi:hypothetical protein
MLRGSEDGIALASGDLDASVTTARLPRSGAGSARATPAARDASDQVLADPVGDDLDHQDDREREDDDGSRGPAGLFGERSCLEEFV